MSNLRGVGETRNYDLRVRDHYAGRPSSELRKELKRLHSSRAKNKYPQLLIIEEILANRGDSIFSGFLPRNSKGNLKS